nr:lymphocyte expansion molecule-like [Onthophagus taurus]
MNGKSVLAKSGKTKSRPFLTRAPFGVQTKRFAAIGFHPGLDPTGSLSAYKQKLAPCDYNPVKTKECAYKTGKMWERMVNSEEFSKNLGFRNAKVLEYRTFMKSMGGPGTYEIPEEIFKKQPSSALENKSFGDQPRFRSLIQNNNPPPATYFRDFSKTSTITKKSFITIPSFEWDGFRDRFRGLNFSFRQPPNRYRINDPNSMENRLKQVSKKKLPYCLFSGQRDSTSIKNHFAPAINCSPDKIYDWQSGMGLSYLLNHPSKSRTGKFFKADRVPKKPIIKNMQDDLATCYKDPTFPGPPHYTIKPG